MSRVRHSSVHTEFVALHLVEFVPGIWILTRSDNCGSNIQILVKILPAYLTWTHIHITYTKPFNFYKVERWTILVILRWQAERWGKRLKIGKDKEKKNKTYRYFWTLNKIQAPVYLTGCWLNKNTLLYNTTVQRMLYKSFSKSFHPKIITKSPQKIL